MCDCLKQKEKQTWGVGGFRIATSLSAHTPAENTWCIWMWMGNEYEVVLNNEMLSRNYILKWNSTAHGLQEKKKETTMRDV